MARKSFIQKVWSCIICQNNRKIPQFYFDKIYKERFLNSILTKHTKQNTKKTSRALFKNSFFKTFTALLLLKFKIANRVALVSLHDVG